MGMDWAVGPRFSRFCSMRTLDTVCRDISDMRRTSNQPLDGWQD